MSIPMRNSTIAALYFRRNLEDGGFDWEHFTHLPISAYLTIPEVQYFNYIATSAKLSGKSKKYKIDMMSEILRPKGFIYMTAGTNRVVFRSDFDQSFLLKIGFDNVGVNDSIREFYNQEVLKPFVPKIFDVSPCGTIGLVERVQQIRSRSEFLSIAPEIFDVLNKKILGKYVLEDIGTDFFKNWGIRDGFGPVLLDFPYVYELDGGRLICGKQLPDGSKCQGLIDYDDGFNTLVCEVCGQRHSAKSLAKNGGALMITKDVLRRKGRSKMIMPRVEVKMRNSLNYGEDSSMDMEEEIDMDMVMKKRPKIDKGSKPRVTVNFGHNRENILNATNVAKGVPAPNYRERTRPERTTKSDLPRINCVFSDSVGKEYLKDIASVLYRLGLKEYYDYLAEFIKVSVDQFKDNSLIVVSEDDLIFKCIDIVEASGRYEVLPIQEEEKPEEVIETPVKSVEKPAVILDPNLEAAKDNLDKCIEASQEAGNMEVRIVEPELEKFETQEIEVMPPQDETSAADRVKIRDFMCDEACDFLDTIDEDKMHHSDIVKLLIDHLTMQCLQKYSKSDPEIIKILVREFIEDSYTENLEKEETPKKEISKEELQAIEY